MRLSTSIKPDEKGQHVKNGLIGLSNSDFMTEALIRSTGDSQTYSSIDPEHPSAMPSSPRVYPGQDNRPTSKRELWAWYSYCFATEVYAVVSLSICILESS